VGHKLKAAINMNVLVYDPYASEMQCSEEGFIKQDCLDDVLKESDIVSISVPLTKDTENMIAARELSIMKKNAIFINTSSGKIINEHHLYHALRNGEIFGAALNVFVEEPISKDHPLLTCDNFIGTPHNSANTVDSLIRMGTGAVDEIVRLLKHEGASSRIS
jgi:D-3-phosphoglycerate dehydrogenase / 2-oxoglutarate reductase